MTPEQALHLARLAAAEAALSALLREAAADAEGGDAPDEVVVRVHAEGGMDVEFNRCGMPVAGEGL